MTKPTPNRDADSAISTFVRNNVGWRPRPHVLALSLTAAVALSILGAAAGISAASAAGTDRSSSTTVQERSAEKSGKNRGKRRAKHRKRRIPPTATPTVPDITPSFPTSTPTMPTDPSTTPSTPTATPTTPAPTSTSPTPSPTTPTDPGEVPVSPDAGVPEDLSLTPSGPLIITEDGTVVDGLDISGNVVVKASDVIIRNSRVTGDSGMGIDVRSGSLVVEDTTVEGFENGVVGDHYTATRVEVTGAFGDGFKIGTDVTLQGSWCHDLAPTPTAHADCGQIQSGVENVLIRGNWFDVGNGIGNAALFLAPDLGPSSIGPLTVENNVLGGGNFSLYCVDGDDGRYFIDAISITGNRFLRNNRYAAMRVNVPALIHGNTYQDGSPADLG